MNEQEQNTENNLGKGQFMVSDKFQLKEEPKRIDSIKPIMCILAIVFKLLAILLLLLLYIETDLCSPTFTISLLLTAIDFWITKNLIGRNLAGLKWWGEINPKTQLQQWVFESCSINRQVNRLNVIIFWASLTVFVIFWVGFTLFTIIIMDLFWFTLGVFCGLLTGINLICFIKCKGTHQKRIKQIGSKFGLAILQSQVIGTNFKDQKPESPVD